MGQQFEFEYAEQAKREGQAINPDPREQTGGSEIQSQPYPTNERAAQPMGGQKIYPQRQRRLRRLKRELEVTRQERDILKPWGQ
jgi:hypothetical protein